MVIKLNESDGYIKVSKDYDDLVLRSIQIAKEMGIEQIIFQSKDGFFGSILAKNGKPVSPLNDDDEVIGKIRLVNRGGKTDAVYVTDYPAKESIKRSGKYSVGKSVGESRTRRTTKRHIKEGYALDQSELIEDMYHAKQQCEEILEKLNEFISDLEYEDVNVYSKSNAESLYYGSRNTVQSLENADVSLSDLVKSFDRAKRFQLGK